MYYGPRNVREVSALLLTCWTVILTTQSGLSVTIIHFACVWEK